MLNVACEVEMKKSVVFTSLMFNHDELKHYVQKQGLELLFFNDAIKALKYVLRNDINCVYFDFSLPASRNLALRVLRSSTFQIGRLILLEKQGDQIRSFTIESIDHFFDLYNAFFIDDENNSDPFDDLSKRDRDFLTNDPGSWCYECRTDSFLTNKYFYNIVNCDKGNKNDFFDSYFSIQSLALSRQMLIDRIRYSIIDEFPFIEEIDLGDCTYRICGCSQRQNGFLFIMGSLREVKKLEGIASKSGLKHNFLSLVSHELLSPLNIIKGYSRLLKDINTEECDVYEYASIIYQSTEELELKLKRMYLLNSFYSNRLFLEDKSLSLISLLKELYDKFRSNLKKDQDLLLSITNTNDDIILFGRHELLFDILICLIENSIKFSEEGPIHVKVHKCTESNRLCFSVSDEGIGFPLYLKYHMFDMFTQQNELASRKFEGLGLGLHFSKCMIAFLGGEIDVISRNKGLIVRFSVPIN
jgi:signal transduction histidine kinase